MKRFVQASLMAILVISSIPTASAAVPSWYRETVFYSTEYGPGTSPFPGPGPTPGGTETRVMVGWVRYYCNGTVRSFGHETGDFEDYYFGDCT